LGINIKKKNIVDDTIWVVNGNSSIGIYQDKIEELHEKRWVKLKIKGEGLKMRKIMRPKVEHWGTPDLTPQEKYRLTLINECNSF
jgi:hypothetical protein